MVFVKATARWGLKSRSFSGRQARIFFFLLYTFVVFAHPSLTDPTTTTVKTTPAWTNLMN